MYFVWELVCESCGCLYMYQICVWEWDWREMWGSPRCAWVASGLIIFIVFVNMSCPVLSLSLFLSFFGGGGGWCELVCVCSRERGGFLFGVGWVFLLFINTWVWCHVQVCVQLHDALICISMPAWLYFFIFHSYWGSPLLRSLWWLFSGCFCWALFSFCLSFLLPNFAGSRLQLPFVRPITYSPWEWWVSNNISMIVTAGRN